MATFKFFRTYSDYLIGNHKGKTQENNLDYGQQLTESRLQDLACIQTDTKSTVLLLKQSIILEYLLKQKGMKALQKYKTCFKTHQNDNCATSQEVVLGHIGVGRNDMLAHLRRDWVRHNISNCKVTKRVPEHYDG